MDFLARTVLLTLGVLVVGKLVVQVRGNAIPLLNEDEDGGKIIRVGREDEYSDTEEQDPNDPSIVENDADQPMDGPAEDQVAGREADVTLPEEDEPEVIITSRQPPVNQQPRTTAKFGAPSTIVSRAREYTTKSPGNTEIMMMNPPILVQRPPNPAPNERGRTITDNTKPVGENSAPNGAPSTITSRVREFTTKSPDDTEIMMMNPPVLVQRPSNPAPNERGRPVTDNTKPVAENVAPNGRDPVHDEARVEDSPPAFAVNSKKPVEKGNKGSKPGKGGKTTSKKPEVMKPSKKATSKPGGKSKPSGKDKGSGKGAKTSKPGVTTKKTTPSKKTGQKKKVNTKSQSTSSTAIKKS